jgi:nucleoside-diphosphate-sugar epimerase
MKVGVIGGNGFLGSAFSRNLKEKSIDYCVIEKDNYDDFVGGKFDLLINANGNSKKFLAAENPLLEFSSTVVSVQRSLLDFKYSMYVLCSTVDVYNNLRDPNFNHENVDIDRGGVSKYGLHKLLAEDLVRNYAKSWLIVRFGGFVGPGLKKNSIYDLVNNVPLRVNIDSAYQYLPTDFAADAVFQLALNKIEKEIFNLCGNGLVSLREVIETLFPAYQVKYYGDNPPVERYEINIGKIIKETAVPDTKNSVFDFVKSLR